MEVLLNNQVRASVHPQIAEFKGEGKERAILGCTESQFRPLNGKFPERAEGKVYLY